MAVIGFNFGGIVGPMLGGTMRGKALWNWAFIPAGVACIVVGLLALTLKAPKAKESAPAAG